MPAFRAPTPADLFGLSGRVAFVSGASRGIGRAIAAALAGAGAHVVMNARGTEALAATVAEFRAAGLSAQADAFDAAGADAGERLAVVAARHGRLDIVVSNAGGTVRKPLAEQTDGDFAAVFAMHTAAAFRLARAAAGPMRAQGGGRILFVSSINAAVARPGIPGYVAAKAGLEGLTRALAVELAPDRITVNALAPGYTSTDGNRAMREADPTFAPRIAARIPAGRWGTPEEMAGAALFLASPAASYTTGIVITVDGGMVAAI